MTDVLIPTRSRFTLLPTTITPWVRATAWMLLVANILIVGTGGLVRLTGSGLGCPTWPLCTDDSLVNTPEMGIHGVIEFGNRVLTGVLVVIAALAFLAVVRQYRQRPELARLTFAVGVGIIVQAVVGGITVWMQLHPSVVGVHYLISAVLVAVAAVHVSRVYAQPGARTITVTPRYAMLAHLTSASVLITVVVGILLTGAGPHAGDDAAARNGLDPTFWQHVHSWPAYITLALTLVLVSASFFTPPALNLRRWTLLLLATELLQVGVGLWQARAGLPIVLVNIHMVLAVTLVAVMTAVVMHLRKAPEVSYD